MKNEEVVNTYDQQLNPFALSLHLRGADSRERQGMLCKALLSYLGAFRSFISSYRDPGLRAPLKVPYALSGLIG